VSSKTQRDTKKTLFEGLLKYAKEVEQVATGGGQSEGDGDTKEVESEAQVSTRPQVVFSFEYKPEGSTKIQIMSDGSVKMSLIMG
jgi:hypothetical protein